MDSAVSAPRSGMRIMSKSRVYFPNLNSIRFVAAIGVIMHHLEMHKHIFGLKNVYTNSFVGGVFGKLGIILFFVLSGFLITYLLMKEKDDTGDISIKAFYVRRIFRIWPVYYLIITLGLFVIPHIHFLHFPKLTDLIEQHFYIKVICLYFFFPNIVDTVFRNTPIPFIDQVWSVGVEEQFYFAWPWMVKYTKNILRMLFGVIIFYLTVKFTLEILFYYNPRNWYIDQMNFFWTYFCIDDMALGGLMAYVLYHKKEKLLGFLFNKYTQIATYVLLAIITVKGVAVPHITFEVYAVLFAIIIINLAANKNTIITFEFKWLDYLGRITYGLYLYHYIAIVTSIKLGILLIDKDNLVLSNIFYYAVTFGGSILMAVISYEFFEKRFLKAKVRFSKVVSGDNAKEEIPETVEATPQISLPKAIKIKEEVAI